MQEKPRNCPRCGGVVLITLGVLLGVFKTRCPHCKRNLVFDSQKGEIMSRWQDHKEDFALAKEQGHTMDCTCSVHAEYEKNEAKAGEEGRE